MLKKIVNVIQSYDSEVKSKIELLIVDDGSEKLPIQKMDLDFDAKFIRILEDVGFNNGGAKNLGIKHAQGEWCLIMDLDHWFDKTNIKMVLDICEGSYKRSILEKIKTSRGLGNYWYLISRVTIDGKKINPNPNVKLVKRNVILECLYDEDFSGHYGYEDVLQMYMLNNIVGKFRTLPGVQVILDEHVQDSNTKCITQRDTSRNKKMLNDKVSGKTPISTIFFRHRYKIL